MSGTLKHEEEHEVAGGFIKMPAMICFLLLIVYYSPQAAWTQEPENNVLNTVVAMMEKSGYSRSLMEIILIPCREAVDNGIPLDFIEPRIQEGLVKDISAQGIAKVVHNEIFLYSQSRTVIQNIQGAEIFIERHNLWSRTANLLSSGVSVSDIEKLIKMTLSVPENYNQSTSLYISLTKWGLTETQSLQIVESVIGSSISSAEYSDLTSLFTKGRSSNIPPEKLISRIVDELPNVRTLRQLEKRVLR